MAEEEACFKNFRIAARGLVIHEDRLLFVSDEGQYWYLPGGRLEAGESLPSCVEREVYEETGFLIKAEQLCYVQERLDLKDKIHKIHFYFQTKILEENKQIDWQDTGGTVQFQRFFTLDEIQSMKNILPRFLASGDWCRFKSTSMPNEGKAFTNGWMGIPAATHTYQGAVKARGFELVDEL